MSIYVVINLCVFAALILLLAIVAALGERLVGMPEEELEKLQLPDRLRDLATAIRDRDLDYRLLMAGDMLSPYVGEEEINPRSDAFSQWIMNLVYEE